MNTKSRVRTAAAAVLGARHLRDVRNGQDATAAWTGDGAGAIVVCDGCGAGASSEVGARLGAQLVIAALARELGAGERPGEPALWQRVRDGVARVLGSLVAVMPGDRAQVIHDHFLFTIVAAAVRGGEAAVWALGDGAYVLEGREHVLGPFPDNQPPYLGYDLLGIDAPAHLARTEAPSGTILVATDGVVELGLGCADDDLERWLAHPDALRRQLAVCARTSERIDWEARRLSRTPAALQDDGALAILRWASEVAA